VAKRRQLVLLNPVEDDRGIATGELHPLGTLDEVTDRLSRFNTASDGARHGQTGTEMLHGPGLIVEIPTAADQITQLMVHVKDEELAFTVLWRMCRANGWKIVDAETGERFG